MRRRSPCSPLELLEQLGGGGEAVGLTTGAKALFCLTAEIIWTGENESGSRGRGGGGGGNEQADGQRSE